MGAGEIHPLESDKGIITVFPCANHFYCCSRFIFSLATATRRGEITSPRDKGTFNLSARLDKAALHDFLEKRNAVNRYFANPGDEESIQTRKLGAKGRMAVKNRCSAQPGESEQAGYRSGGAIDV